MAKTKMTNDARLKARKALLVHACAQRALDLARQEDALAERALAEIYSPEERKKMAKLPEGWLDTDYDVNVNAAGWSVCLCLYQQPTLVDHIATLRSKGMFYGNSVFWGDMHPSVRRIPLPAKRPGGNGGDATRYVVKDADLAAEIQAHAQALRGWQEEFLTLNADISSTIAGFRTVEALLEAIPELATLAPDLKKIAAVPANALVPTVERLMCSIAKIRGEERDGCCDGKRIADNENIEPTQAA